MTPSFKPPAGDSLAEVDIADLAYDDGCIVIEGVVSPGGQGGWPGRTGDYYVHAFAFAGWRRPGDSLVEGELTLLRPVPPARPGQDHPENIFEQFPGYSIHRLSVLLSKNRKRAVVEKALTIDRPDQELLLFSERLRQPVVISTERFGDVVLNPKLDWFEGWCDWNGKRIKIMFDRDGAAGIGAAIQIAEQLWFDQAAWKRKVDNFAVKKLIPAKKEYWLREGEVEPTELDFRARMELVSITVRGDGHFEFWHNDGELFWGHRIQISGDLKDGVTDADVPQL